jgi:hypothetical protein
MGPKGKFTENTDVSSNKGTYTSIIRFFKVKTLIKSIQNYVFSKSVEWVFGRKCTAVFIISIRVVASPARDWGDIADSKSDDRS